ncbi:hypothetical protein K2F40_11985 [Clostridium sp. CM028]|uniref:CLC_0170 family protein n=1 Tax=unclassified Clostridium TaxID=2614128 RepID=UPI001C0D36F6|nr:MULTISPECIES: CLC_0170 family protein [unclassified Clostridium]MBU3092589.1 hypothetical protein [Clostridium sp. CF011]MBW9146210.1 hypothetical protein [Clostridium sp. CM027]MBW9149682.1 hypothetical protein [Clostridium sp. CM028]UVE39811.1 hypothetical protein KTC92_11265 [Clostridium sp. CM027]WAG68718.1 hypothetical protein LL036_11485 [Clostridium sp. CF011]
MRVLELFDIYFLTMMVVQGAVVLAVDVRNFKKSGMGIISKKARVLGWLAIITAIVLFTLRWIF